MPSKFSSGKYAIAQCDRCNFRYKLHELRIEIIKTKPYQIKVCKTCWDPDQPQLSLGLYPVNDPQAVRDPRPDSPSYIVSGNTGLQINLTGIGPDGAGDPGGGSRIIQWGWNPVGGAAMNDDFLTPNNLQLQVSIGTVTVTTSQEQIMAYKKGADGVTKTGKTKGKNLGDSGPTVGVMGGKGKMGAKTVTSMSMKKMGRNLARAANQK